MSIHTRARAHAHIRLMWLFVVVIVAGWFGPGASAQNVKVHIALLPESSHAVIEIAGPPRSQWSFRDVYARAIGLGSRIENFSAADAAGREVKLRKLAPGQFESDQKAAKVKYEVRLSPPFPADSAFVSWLTVERGVLMLSDLLPLSLDTDAGRAAEVEFTLPAGWRVASIESSSGANQFQVADLDRAVFAVGRSLRVSEANVAGLAFRLVADGVWAFGDADAIELASRVLRSHRETFRAMPFHQAQLILFPFPQATAANLWTAETRGANVTLLSGRVPSKIGALAQLSTPLTHELFHLWVPNGLALEGDYDWFYEGFTVYEAARTAVRLDLLTFPEFLTAMGRAYDGYLANPDHDRWSLIEASRHRWATGQSAVYSESMLMAFLYDLKLRSSSRGKQSIESIYPALMQKYGRNSQNSKADGNEAAISAIGQDDAARAFVRTYITQPARIDLVQELAPFGLQVETFGLRTRIGVADSITKQQRDLLQQLGYNEVTRKRKN